MFKKCSFFFLIVCVLSVFGLPCTSDAGTMVTSWDNPKQSVLNAYQRVWNEVNLYHDIRSGVDTLISDWDRNEKAIMKSRTITLLATGGVIVSAVVAITSSGSLAPAAYAAIAVAVKAVNDEDDTSRSREDYLSALSSMVGLMDTARSNVTAAYYGGYLTVEGGRSLYTKGYDRYCDEFLLMAQGHIDGYTLSALESSVKMGKLYGYYHEAPHSGDESSRDDHVFPHLWPLTHWAVKGNLPSKYKCKGSCKQKFRTPYSPHLVVCGIDRETFSSGSKSSFDDSVRPCWTAYYTCKRDTCPDARYHVNADEANSGSSTENPAVAPSPTPTPTPTTRSASLSSSSSWVSPYQSVSFSLSTNTAFSSVSWYVKSRGSWGLGTLIETDNGSSSSYSASLSYSFSGSGDYVITADIADYSDGSWYQASATVNVSSSSYDNTPDCSSCTDGCSSCDGSSGDSGSDDGDSGDSGNPGSSTPQWWCANSCGARLHSSRAHDAGTCSNCGHSYWSCYTSTVEYHTQTYTCARPGCGASFTECTNFLGSCIAAHLYHQKP